MSATLAPRQSRDRTRKEALVSVTTGQRDASVRRSRRPAARSNFPVVCRLSIKRYRASGVISILREQNERNVSSSCKAHWCTASISARLLPFCAQSGAQLLVGCPRDDKSDARASSARRKCAGSRTNERCLHRARRTDALPHFLLVCCRFALGDAASLPDDDIDARAISARRKRAELALYRRNRQFFLPKATVPGGVRLQSAVSCETKFCRPGVCPHNVHDTRRALAKCMRETLEMTELQLHVGLRQGASVSAANDKAFLVASSVPYY